MAAVGGVEKWEARSGFHSSMPLVACEPCFWCWWPIPQRRVRPNCVVVDAPAFGQHAQFLQRVENLSIQKLIPELRVERLAIAVFPWRARFDIQCLRARVDQPLTQVFGYELGAVAPREGSCTIAENQEVDPRERSDRGSTSWA